MERASQSIVFESAVAEVGATVGAGAINQSQFAVAVAEQHQTLAQQRDRHDGSVTCQFIAQRGRVPIVAHHSTGFCIGSGQGQGVV